jgi:hypothetical protein
MSGIVVCFSPNTLNLNRIESVCQSAFEFLRDARLIWKGDVSVLAKISCLRFSLHALFKWRDIVLDDSGKVCLGGRGEFAVSQDGTTGEDLHLLHRRVSNTYFVRLIN